MWFDLMIIAGKVSMPVLEALQVVWMLMVWIAVLMVVWLGHGDDVR